MLFRSSPIHVCPGLNVTLSFTLLTVPAIPETGIVQVRPAGLLSGMAAGKAQLAAKLCVTGPTGGAKHGLHSAPNVVVACVAQIASHSVSQQDGSIEQTLAAQSGATASNASMGGGPAFG